MSRPGIALILAKLLRKSSENPQKLPQNSLKTPQNFSAYSDLILRYSPQF
jgi:hypothetical protein